MAKFHLREALRTAAKGEIETELTTLTEHEAEYRSYLEASLANISACHAGYFSQDNRSSDEDIAKEVDEILREKKQLLSFKKSTNIIRDGSCFLNGR